MKRKIFGCLSIIIASSTLLAGSEMESKEIMSEPVSFSKQFDSFEFHGYFRTGSDGNLDDSFKKVYDKNKNLIGRWGNEYDSFTAFNFSNTFKMENGAWAKLFVELDNWNSSLDISSDINLASAKIEMGKIPGFTGAFEESIIVAGKQGWDNRAVDMTDYFYQDIDAVGLGINGVKLGNGNLGLAYLTAEFEDKTDRYYRPSLDNYPPYSEVKNIETSDSIRAIKAKYEIENFSIEGMYAHAPDHDSVKFLCEESVDETIYSRDTAD
ncbi:MAG: carbohydrate porin, partial [Cetobacterium sp.]